MRMLGRGEKDIDEGEMGVGDEGEKEEGREPGEGWNFGREGRRVFRKPCRGS